VGQHAHGADLRPARVVTGGGPALAGGSERIIDLPGGPLAVDDPGAGRPMLWAHGLTSSREREDVQGFFDWRAAAPGWRVVRYDARGHGRSAAGPTSDAYRWDVLGAELLALADALGLDRFVAGGASMGAATTLHAAVAAPERVVAMVLVIPPTAWGTRASQRDLYRAAADLIEREGLDAYLAAVGGRPAPAIFAEVPELVTMPPCIDEVAMPSVLRGAGESDLPDADALRRLAMPTLVLAWDTDPTHPVSTAERLAEVLPDARLVVATTLAEVGTWPAAVADFLEQVGGGRTSQGIGSRRWSETA
jgi:3-oxoadipate enol-lactonase